MIRARRTGATGTANAEGNAHHVGAFNAKGLTVIAAWLRLPCREGSFTPCWSSRVVILVSSLMGPPELQRCLQLQQILVGNQGSTQKEILHFSLGEII